MADEKQIQTRSKEVEEEVSKESSIRPTAKDKGKMIDIPSDSIRIPEINPTDPNQLLEVRVYRKWVSKNVPDPNPTGLCFILLDRDVSSYSLK